MFPVLIDIKNRIVLAKVCPRHKDISNKNRINALKEWKKQNIDLTWVKSYSTIHH